MQKKALLFILAAFLTFDIAMAQDDFTIGHLQNMRDADIYFKGVNTAIRPTTGVENEVYDSLIYPKNDKVEKNWFVRKLFHEHLFIIGNEKYKVYIDPIFDFRYNRLQDLTDPSNPVGINGYTNTRGAIVHAKLSEYVYLNTSFFENQAVLPAYMEDIYAVKGNIPGYARVKKLNGFSEFDYANAYGNISFRPIKCLNFTLGYDRLFIGDGLHSMILSDYAAPMPYVKTCVKFGKWEYVNLVTRLMQYNTMQNVETADKTSKVATYNMMIFNPQNGWQFTFFEQSVIDHRNKTFWGGLAQGVPVARLFYPIFADNTNARFGANVMYEHPKIGIFYTQMTMNIDKYIMINSDSSYTSYTEPNMDFQIGYKNHNLLNVKGLHIQLEYNLAYQFRTFWRSNVNGNGKHSDWHSPNTLNSNYGQSLTIPKNQRTYLFTAMLSYQIKWFKVMAMYNISPHTTYLEPYYISYAYPDNFVHPRDQFDFQFVYEMNPVNRMQWFAGISMYNLAGKPLDYYFSIGFRTALRNNY